MKRKPKKRVPIARELAPQDNTAPLETNRPQFGQPIPTPDPTSYRTPHSSDKAAYKILDAQKGAPLPRTFPVNTELEPVMTLSDALDDGGSRVAQIQKLGQIVFHALGDTGNTRSAKDENTVTDKLVSDFTDERPEEIPAFCYNLGDVVYSFGEAAYYYDQFYDPYRDYPAPIFAIAGNHDGMVAPNTTTPSLQAFLENFCAYGQAPHRTPESGGLVRTANRQPGVYFTLEAPFVRILGIYSNCLEDPGIISSQKGYQGVTYPGLPDVQLDFLVAALKRVKTDKFTGAVIIAVHHPPYVAVTNTDEAWGKHGGSPIMLADIDQACQTAGVWPHAVLSGHAHNQQRFTRRYDGRETPFVICGNGGHAHQRLTKKGDPTLRTPAVQALLSNGQDEVTFESYDDANFGYLRIIVDAKTLTIEYHPASDGDQTKTPDDVVSVDLATYKLAP